MSAAADTVHFDRAGDPDWPDLIQMMQDFYLHEEIPFDPEDALRALRGLDAGPAGAAWIIREDTMPVGYMVVTHGYSLEFHGRDAFVDELYVRPAFRGRGIGTEALAVAGRYCAVRGINALHLEVDGANHRAHRLYTRVGFSEHRRHLMTKWIAAPLPSEPS